MASGLNVLRDQINEPKCTDLIELMKTANTCAMNFVADLVTGMKILSRQIGDDVTSAQDFQVADRVTNVHSLVKDT